jgi:signal transduction histidine kinase
MDVVAASGKGSVFWARDDLAGDPDEPVIIAAAGVLHDLGNLIQIASSAINIIGRNQQMPAIHTGPIIDRARLCLEHAGALVRQNIELLCNRTITDENSSIATCVTDVATMIEALGEPDFRVEFQVEPNLREAQCDAVGMCRALLNLVLNARDAMDGCGLVRIEARTIWNGPIAVGVELCVADNGVGMSAAMIERACDPFFTTKVEGRSGIGLPMVERFARNAGGEIAIESQPGIGTTVMLRLPATLRTTGAGGPIDVKPPTEEAGR